MMTDELTFEERVALEVIRHGRAVIHEEDDPIGWGTTTKTVDFHWGKLHLYNRYGQMTLIQELGKRSQAETATLLTMTWELEHPICQAYIQKAQGVWR